MELDKLNLQILKEISSGFGLSIDYGLLSQKLGKHRSTIKRRIDDLFENKIITPPIYFPLGLITKEFPLFVIVFADLPETTKNWLSTDENIFAAFRIIEGDYNTLIFEYHKTVLSYHIWRENLVKQNKIPSREHRHASESYHFSNDLIQKYEPNAVFGYLEEEFNKNKKININNYEIDFVGFNILKNLLSTNKYIKINKNLLSQKLAVHRKTIELRIKKLRKLELIDYPSCNFLNFFAPPTFYLVLTFLEISAMQDEIIEDLKKDYNVPIVYKISAGKYNLSIISSHPSIDDFFYWNLKYKNKFSSIKSQKNVYLSPNMIIFLNQKKIVDRIIDKKMRLQEIEA